MRLRDLLKSWETSAKSPRTSNHYAVRLPLREAAKLAALRELYPGRSEEDLITDLLSAALDELEVVFPYVQGDRVITEDEQGDPVYDDAGQTPRFQVLQRRHMERLRGELDKQGAG